MEFEYEVTIAAPPELVWSVLIDVEAWPTWTSSMTWLRAVDDGPLEWAAVHIKQPGSRATSWTITALEAGRSFVVDQGGGAHGGRSRARGGAGGTVSRCA
jgi:uncharacterized protein YndB with AHSA1/START domain